jgi:surface antigen
MNKSHRTSGRPAPIGALAAACTALLFAACESPPSPRDTGMIIGGVIGGVIGHELGGGRSAATIVGTLIGAAVGGEIGRSMRDTDRLRTAHALETVRSGVPTQWVNPDTGHRYTVVPTRTVDGRAGPCREYTIDASIGGRAEKAHGTACRQADGSWRVMP